MAKFSTLWKIMDAFTVGVLGINFAELFIIDMGLFDKVDGWMQYVMGLVAVLYGAGRLAKFLLIIPEEIKMKQIERKKKQEELEQMQIQTDALAEKKT